MRERSAHYAHDDTLGPRYRGVSSFSRTDAGNVAELESRNVYNDQCFDRNEIVCKAPHTENLPGGRQLRESTYVLSRAKEDCPADVARAVGQKVAADNADRTDARG